MACSSDPTNAACGNSPLEKNPARAPEPALFFALRLAVAYIGPMAEPKPTAPLAVAGLLARCPRCGRGELFEGYLKVRPGCAVCGLCFAGHDTADGPAFFIMMPLSILTAVLALLVEVYARPPVWVHIAIWPAFIIAFAGLALRPVKATMIALQYRFRDVEREISS